MTDLKKNTSLRGPQARGNPVDLRIAELVHTSTHGIPTGFALGMTW